MTRTASVTFARLAGSAALVLALLTPSATAATPSSELEASLIHMVAEEKLAHDVYLALDALYDVPVFANIASSEARHSDAVRTLLASYGVEDPTLGDAAGVFDDPAFQALYDELVAQGSASLEAAVAVGVAIEELDIDDLQVAIATGLPGDVERVYTQLLAGSESHLAAFTSQRPRLADGGTVGRSSGRAAGFGRTNRAGAGVEASRRAGRGHGGPLSTR